MTIEKTTRGFKATISQEYHSETQFNAWEKHLSTDYMTRKDEFIAPMLGYKQHQ